MLTLAKPKRLFFAFLAVLALASLAVSAAHPHFEAETAPGFWAVFGLAGGVILSVAAGAVLGPLVRLKEDAHED